MLLFAFQTLASGWLLIVCLAAASLLTWLLYRRQQRFERPWSWILPTLRFAGLFLLFILLLSPFVVLTLQQEEKPTLLVYLDQSASVSGEVNTLYEQSLKEPLKAMEEKYNVRILRFADRVYEAGDTLKAVNATDLGCIPQHMNNYRDFRRVAAVLVLSDGIQNRGLSPLVTPLMGSPVIYTVGLGDTTPQSDVRISGVQVNESVFLGSEFSVEVQLQCNAAFLSPYKVELFDGSRFLQSQSGSFSKGNGYKRLVFSLKAGQAGLKQFRVVVSPLQGEKNLANNQATAVTEVVDDRKNTVIVQAASHPDVGAIRRLLEGNARYNVSLADPGFLPNPQSADIFIVHGMPVNENQAAWLKRLTETGKPFFHISTLQTRRSLLGAMPGGMSPAANGQSEEALPQPSPDFTEIAFEPEVMRRILTFPPLKVAYGRWQTDGTQKVFLKQRIGNIETPYPLHYFRDAANSRNVWLCGEGFWRWRMREYSAFGDCKATEALLFQSLQYLSVNARPRTLVLKSLRNAYEAGENVMLQATYTDAAGNRDNKSGCELVLEGEKGFKRLYSMAASQDMYRLEATGLPPGQYKATARLNKNPGQMASTVFFISELVEETFLSQANHEVLRQWSAKNKGVFVSRKDVGTVVETLKNQESARPVIFQETKITELIHAKWFFLVIVCCFALEWFMRKFLGGY